MTPAAGATPSHPISGSDDNRPGRSRLPSPEAVRAAVEVQRTTAEALFARLEEGSRGAPGIMRDTYGPGENWGHRVLLEHAETMGLETSQDAAANTHATWRGRAQGSAPILIGSHLDSVPHGGNFDGAAGVLAGLVVVSALRDLGVAPSCDLTVMGIRAEESVWFEVSYVGSRSALGTLPDGALSAKRIDTGRSLADHMRACGGDPEALPAGTQALDPSGIRAFLEIHIEQAPSLVEAGYPVAICTGITGNFRYPNARVDGRHDHVGTPRRFCRDAAMAAVALAAGMDRIWAEEEAHGTPLAITFGRFHTDAGHHSLTVVPGSFHFSLDVRAYDAAVLNRLESRTHQLIAGIEAERRVTFVLGPRASGPVGNVDLQIAAALTDTAARLGIPTMPIGSAASHDAAAFAAAGVPTAMLFVRSENGSHNPHEAMAIDDFLDACAILATWVAETVG